MARRAFDPENAVWRPLGFLGDIVTLSLLWALCSLPVVTIGSASCALYDAASLRPRPARLVSTWLLEPVFISYVK